MRGGAAGPSSHYPEGERPGSVGIRDGVIVAVDGYDAPPASTMVVEIADDKVLMPGVVDTHVHVNDPGRTHWEGFTPLPRHRRAEASGERRFRGG